MITSVYGRMESRLPKRSLRSLFLICHLVVTTSLLLSSPMVLLAAPVPPNSIHKSGRPQQRKTVPKSSGSKNRVVVKIQSGAGNHQDSPDYSVHIGHQDNRKYSSSHTSITYITKVYNKTITLPPANGISFGFGIIPASPIRTGNPLKIPFVLTNMGTKSLYNIKCNNILHDIEFKRGHGLISIKDSGFYDHEIRQAIFHPNDHLRLDIGLFATILGGNVTAEPGTTADIEFVVKFSKTPNGPEVTSSYRFSLVLINDAGWDWVKTS